MNYSGISNDIDLMVKKELESANEQFPPFHSLHEAYAVIKEEVEEATLYANSVEGNFAFSWHNIKCNEETKALKELADVKKYAIELIKEAVQICAMCDKAEQSLKKSTK